MKILTDGTVILKIIPRGFDSSIADVEFWRDGKLAHKTFYRHGIETVIEFTQQHKIKK